MSWRRYFSASGSPLFAGSLPRCSHCERTLAWRQAAVRGLLLTGMAVGMMGCGPAAAAAAAGHIYIAGSGQLRAINVGTLNADGQLHLPGPVVAAAVDHQRHRLDLLVGGNANALLAVDISGLKPPHVLAQRALGMTPVTLRLAPDAQRVYVLGRFGTGPGKVEAIDLASGHVAAWTMTGARPADLALSGDGTHLAV